MGNCSSGEMGGASSTAHLDRKSVVVVPASGENGAVRRSIFHSSDLPETFFPGKVHTNYEAFQNGLRISGDKPCLGYRPVVSTTVGEGGKTEVVVAETFRWFTYTETDRMIKDLASGIMELGLAAPNDTGHRFVGLYGKNRWEWVVGQQSLFSQSLCSVPLYDTLGASAVAFIVRQTGMTTIMCSRVEAAKLVKWKKADTEGAFATLKNVVQWEEVTAEEKAAASASGLELRSFAAVEEIGKAHPKAPVPPKSSDYAVICYTSGTTGDPKGAILTHKVMIADASNAFWGNLGITNEDCHLSYLPLAHVFEQLVENALFMVGASIGFYQGDTLKILEDIKALRPTIFPSVPRLFNRIHDKIKGGVMQAGGLKASLFNRAFAAKQAGLRDNYLTHSFWDGLVFNAVKARVGLDRCRLMVSGSAPLASHVMEFLRIVFSCQVVEGYGQTECGGAATVTDPADQASLGHVGGPLASNEIKLVSCPDLGYLVTDTVHGEERDKTTGAIIKKGVPCEGRGEICFRGPNVFPGYYKDPVNTAAALDAEGWLHSGDIGIWDARGQIKIVDRKKQIFKLSQGEYIAAEKVENEMLSQWVQQVFLYGDSFHSMVIAIVVPNADNLKPWAASKPGKAGKTMAELCADPEVIDMILKDTQAQCKGRGLQGFEIPKALHLEPNPWTPEDILTPSFKLKRKEAKERYLAQINELYLKLETVAGVRDIKQG